MSRGISTARAGSHTRQTPRHLEEPLETKNLPRKPGNYGPFVLNDDGTWGMVELVPVGDFYVAQNWEDHYTWQPDI